MSQSFALFLKRMPDCHYIDVIMTAMASQITSLTVVYSTVYSDADQRKHQSSTSQASVWGIHRDRHAEIVSILWRHHGYDRRQIQYMWKSDVGYRLSIGP